MQMTERDERDSHLPARMLFMVLLRPRVYLPLLMTSCRRELMFSAFCATDDPSQPCYLTE